MRAHTAFRSSERTGRPFSADVLLPTQQLDMLQRPTSPERRLVIAILADAVSCVQAPHLARSRRARRTIHEAETWLMSTDRDWPFSFENICDILCLDAAHLRRTLRQGLEGSRPAAE